MTGIENDVRLIYSLVSSGKKVLSKSEFIKQTGKMNTRVTSLIDATTGENAMFELLGKVGANYMKAALRIMEDKKLVGMGLATVTYGSFLRKPEFQLFLDLPDDTSLRGKSETRDHFMLMQTGGKNNGLKELYDLQSGDVEYSNNHEYIISDKKEEINARGNLDTTFFNKDGEVIKETCLTYKEGFEWYLYKQLVKNGKIKSEVDLEHNRTHIIFDDKLNRRVISLYNSEMYGDGGNKDEIRLYIRTDDDYMTVDMDKNLNVLSYSTSFSQSFPQLKEACHNHSQLPVELIKQYDMEEFLDIYKQLPAIIEKAKATYREKISQTNSRQQM